MIKYSHKSYIMKKILFLAGILILIYAGTSLLYHNTQQADINYYQGRRLFEKGKFEQAMQFFHKASDVEPSRLDALKDLAYAYQWTGAYEKAGGIFQQILSLKPHDNEIKKSLAQTLSWQKEYEKAIRLYKEVIVDSDSLDAKRQLAEVYIWNNQFKEAKEILAEILKIAPQDRKAKFLLAKAMQYSGQAEQAIKIYKELLQEKNRDE